MQSLAIFGSYRGQWYDEIIALYVRSIIAVIVTRVTGNLEEVGRLVPAFGERVAVLVYFQIFAHFLQILRKKVSVRYRWRRNSSDYT